MLFQEKAAKELLEFNNRREGPILEGDQKYFFELVKDIPDDNKKLVRRNAIFKKQKYESHADQVNKF